MSGNNNTSQDLNNMDQVNKAIAMLAIRVGKLETDAPAMGKWFHGGTSGHHRTCNSSANVHDVLCLPVSL